MKSKLFFGIFYAFVILFNPFTVVGQCPSLGVVHTQIQGQSPGATVINNAGEEVKFIWPAGSASGSIQFTATASITYFIYGANGALYASGTCSGPFSFPCGSIAPGGYFLVRFCNIGSPTNIVQLQALSGGPLALKDNRLAATATNQGIELNFHPTTNSLTTIFRSSNGRDFEEIAIVAGPTFLDRNPHIGPNYYRVENQEDRSKISVAYWASDGPLRFTCANPLPVGFEISANVSGKILFTNNDGQLINDPGVGIFCVWIIDDQIFYIGRIIFQ